MLFPVPACRLGAVAILFFATAQPVCASDASGIDFSGSAALTSDYVFRGISQTQGRSALQAGLRIDTDSGLYGSAWASSIDFASAPDATSEVDYVLGWHGKWSADLVGDINATWFTYPSTTTPLDYVELIATATYRERSWLMLGASSNVFATGRTGLYAQAGVRIPLDEHLRLELAGGYYRLERAYGRSYAHGQLTAAWLLHPRVEVRITGHLTGDDARVVFGDAASSRIEAAIQASF